MQTPLQILHKILSKRMAAMPDDPTTYERGLYDAYLNAQKEAEALYESEKSAFISAVEWGQRNEAHHAYWSRGNEYYNENFKKE